VPGIVFEELRAIQRDFGYLPADRLTTLAAKINVPVSQIHAVASFYPHFHLSPPPQVDVRVCADMSCHLRGSDKVRSALDSAFQGTDPKEVCIRDVSCLGRCDQAPAITVNDNIYSHVNSREAVTMAQDVLAGKPLPGRHQNPERMTVVSDPYQGKSQYAVVRRLVETRNSDEIIAALKAAGLRGMGGAGFPTSSKWELVRNAPGSPKYIVCNADESEPGTIKDRGIMENVPYLVIEGMITAGLVTGARKGILYIRHEYEGPREVLQEEIDRCYQQGLLGSRILGSGLAFDLEIFVSPGGYICGEESALLEAIEGKRAEPRNKPPFPVTNGLWNQPTVINNVETFCLATVILARGADWYKAQGKNGSVGMKFVGISGDVNRPGIFEVPMGTTYGELIYENAGGIPNGGKLLAFAPSGPSSGYLPASMTNLPLDWNAVAAAGSMIGSGAIVVCAEGRCMLDMALNATRFYRNESCGKCVPCRVGSQKLVEMLKGWTAGQGSKDDMQILGELSTAMRLTSICGLGQVVPVPIASVMKHFPGMVEQHIVHRRCPAGFCFNRSREIVS
jgi:NADH:ubiquinone oxidoreductase subunit F (NADH-binding)/NADH:ubiquinone oxidoreductase subunit E